MLAPQIKKALQEMKTGETRNFSDSPCYPILVTKLGQDEFRVEWCQERANLSDTVKRLKPQQAY